MRPACSKSSVLEVTEHSDGYDSGDEENLTLAYCNVNRSSVILIIRITWCRCI